MTCNDDDDDDDNNNNNNNNNNVIIVIYNNCGGLRFWRFVTVVNQALLHQSF